MPLTNPEMQPSNDSMKQLAVVGFGFDILYSGAAVHTPSRSSSMRAPNPLIRSILQSVQSVREQQESSSKKQGHVREDKRRV